MARIADMRFYIPQTNHTYEEIASQSGLPPQVVRDKLGIVRKPVETRLSLLDMAHIAAKQLFDAPEAELRLRNTRTVIYSGSDAKGRDVWTLAPKLGHMLGLTRYYGFDVSSQCVGGLVGLHLASRLVGGSNYVVLSVATKQSALVDYADPSSTFMFDFSDGAMGALVTQDEGPYELLGSSFLSDGWFSDVVYAEESRLKLEVHEVEGWREKMKKESKNNFLYVVEEALSQSGVGTRRIGFLGLVHMKKSFHAELLEALGLDPSQSVYLEEHGHMQGVDPFLALHLAQKQGKIKRGDTVVLASAGTGWTWGACALEAV